MKGEMAMVGPVRYRLPTPLFSAERAYDTPYGRGSRLAQVRGRHGIPWEEKFAFDLYYAKHVSFCTIFTFFG